MRYFFPAIACGHRSVWNMLMRLSSDYSWPLCWQKQAGNSTEKTCLVSHIIQLQSCSACVAPMNSRRREKAPLLCLHQGHLPFSRLPSVRLILPNPRDAFRRPCCHSVKNQFCLIAQLCRKNIPCNFTLCISQRTRRIKKALSRARFCKRTHVTQQLHPSRNL